MKRARTRHVPLIALRDLAEAAQRAADNMRDLAEASMDFRDAVLETFHPERVADAEAAANILIARLR